MSTGPSIRVWDSCISCSPLRQDFLQFWFALPEQNTAKGVHNPYRKCIQLHTCLCQSSFHFTTTATRSTNAATTIPSHLLGASVQSSPSPARVRPLPAFPALACVWKALSAWKYGKAAARRVHQCRLVLHLLQIFLQNQSLPEDVDACGCSIQCSILQKITGTWGAFWNPHIQAWPPDHPLVDCAADLSDLKPQRWRTQASWWIKHGVWQQQAKAYASFCRPCLAVVGALAGALAGPLPEGELGIQDKRDVITKTWLPLPLKNALPWNYSEFRPWVADCFSPRSCRIRFLLQICRARCAPAKVQSIQLAVWDQELSTLLHRTTGCSYWHSLHVHSFSRSAVFARRQHLVMSGDVWWPTSIFSTWNWNVTSLVALCCFFSTAVLLLQRRECWCGHVRERLRQNTGTILQPATWNKASSLSCALGLSLQSMSQGQAKQFRNGIWQSCLVISAWGWLHPKQ